MRPHRGAIVSPITPTDVREFYAVKGLLEGDAARLATPHLRPRDITRLADLNRLMGEAARRNDVKGVFRPGQPVSRDDPPGLRQRGS